MPPSPHNAQSLAATDLIDTGPVHKNLTDTDHTDVNLTDVNLAVTLTDVNLAVTSPMSTSLSPSLTSSPHLIDPHLIDADPIDTSNTHTNVIRHLRSCARSALPHHSHRHLQRLTISTPSSWNLPHGLH